MFEHKSFKCAAQFRPSYLVVAILFNKLNSVNCMHGCAGFMLLFFFFFACLCVSATVWANHYKAITMHGQPALCSVTACCNSCQDWKSSNSDWEMQNGMAHFGHCTKRCSLTLPCIAMHQLIKWLLSWLLESWQFLNQLVFCKTVIAYCKKKKKFLFYN